jgi:hypothetical protein
MDAHRLLAVTSSHALRFFFEHLRDVTEGDHPAERELLYNASVLAHFASTSSASFDFPGAPSSLTQVFDIFVMDRSQHSDPEILEAAGSQCLLLTGFFGAQLRGPAQRGLVRDAGRRLLRRRRRADRPTARART